VVLTGSQVHGDFLHRSIATSCFDFCPVQLLFLLLRCEDSVRASLRKSFASTPFLLASLEFLVTVRKLLKI
jgi:hypothetical protein